MFHCVMTAAAALLLALSLAGAPLASAASYRDVGKDHWAYEDIAAVTDRGLMQGYGGSFRPDDPVSRQAFLSILCRASGLDDRKLEKGTGWADPAVAYAACFGWLPKEGFPDRAALITREQAARLLINALYPDALKDCGTASFPDQSDMDADSLPYIRAAVKLGLMDRAADGRFLPRENLTRADAAALLHRTLPAPTAGTGASVQVPVLMYHDVSYLGQGYSKTPEIFEKQLQELKDAGFHTVFFSQLIDYVENGAPLPDKPIVVSIDDGYASNYTYIFPILQKLDMKAEISVIGDAMEYSEWGLKWDQIREMSDSGLVAFQAHTRSLHADNTAQGGRLGVQKLNSESWQNYVKLIAGDTASILDMVERETGKRPQVYTYPRGQWNPMADAIAGKLGCKVSLTTRDGVARVRQGDLSSLRLMDRIGMDFRNGSVVSVLRQFGYKG